MIKSYRKKPLTVRAFQFTGWAPVSLDELGIVIRASRGLLGSPKVYELFNPGTGKWAEISSGDYVVIAPTGCRYPVQADQFERNYEEPVDGAS